MVGQWFPEGNGLGQGSFFARDCHGLGTSRAGARGKESGPCNGASLRAWVQRASGTGRLNCPEAQGLQSGGERRWRRSGLGALRRLDDDRVSVAWSLGDGEPKAGAAASGGLEQVVLNGFLDSFDGESFTVAPKPHDGLQGKGAVGLPLEARGLVGVATEACYAGGDVFRRPNAAPLVSGGRGLAASMVAGGTATLGTLALVTCGADKVVLLELHQFAAIAPLLVRRALLLSG